MTGVRHHAGFGCILWLVPFQRSRPVVPYPIFDRSRLRLRPLAERQHDMTADDVVALDGASPWCDDPALPRLATRIRAARAAGRPVILIMGAHPIKLGLSRVLVALIGQGDISHVALNGAGMIHDYELATIGATTESVARYIHDGQFGLWRETGQLNALISAAAAEGLGIGEAVGRALQHAAPPWLDLSLLAAGFRHGVPVTVHLSIGQDIIHQHPDADGAAYGAASYTDFLVFTHAVAQLEGGVLLNVGSAVMGPEVYLKALAMARNVAAQEGRRIARFTTGVFDLVPLPDERQREAAKDDPAYYYRPFKTILVRTVRDGGESHYVCGDHRATLPTLYRLLHTGARDGT